MAFNTFFSPQADLHSLTALSPEDIKLENERFRRVTKTLKLAFFGALFFFIINAVWVLYLLVVEPNLSREPVEASYLSPKYQHMLTPICFIVLSLGVVLILDSLRSGIFNRAGDVSQAFIRRFFTLASAYKTDPQVASFVDELIRQDRPPLQVECDRLYLYHQKMTMKAKALQKQSEIERAFTEGKNDYFSTNT